MEIITRKWLNDRGVINSYDIAERAGSLLMITYHSAEHGSAAHTAYWSVYGMGFNTDKGGPWYQYGRKIFSVSCREEKDTALKQAIEWCHVTYHTLTFERDPFGAYQETGTMRKLLNKINGKTTIASSHE